MDRRSFLTSMIGGLGAAVAVAVLTPKSAEAASLLDDLKAMDNGAPNPADLPAEGAIETQRRGRGGFRGGRGGFRGGRGGFRGGRVGFGRRRRFPVLRGRRRRCWLVRNRWGRLVRRCVWW